MQTELHRLSTFWKWSAKSRVSPIFLAKCGFWYTGRDDEVECFSCKTRFSASENPLEKHRERSQYCDFLKNATGSAVLENLDCNNQSSPISDDCKDDICEDYKCGIVDRCPAKSDAHENCPQSSQLSEIHNAAPQQAQAKDLFLTKTVSNIESPKLNYDWLRIEENRLSTFHDWPGTAPVEPTDLAREGFFYTGSDDRVICVFCKACISNWEPGEVPSVEHKKHCPECPFVRGIDVGNVAIFPNAFVIDTKARSTTPLQLRSADSSKNRPLDLVRKLTSDQHDLYAMTSGDQPSFPNYSDYKMRVDSIGRGVVGQGQTAENLAAAGLFHVGKVDEEWSMFCWHI